jgi:hypothetical protein
MEPSETATLFLHEIAARADHAGQVLLAGSEIDFALSPEGSQLLEPIDQRLHLFKLTPIAHERLAM